MSPDRRGFILPTSILVLTLLTVMLAAAFLLVSAEFRTTSNSASSGRALGIAQAGLSSYLSTNRGLDTNNTSDSTRITFSGGYADVIARRMRPATGSQLSLWTVRSLGYATDPQLPGTPLGRRAVAVLADLYPGRLPARAALIALNGVVVYNSSSSPYSANPISGNDFGGSFLGCNPTGTAADDTAGVATVTGLYTQTSGNNPGGEGTGGLDLFASAATLYDSTHIDWAALTDTTSQQFTPDYIVPPGSLPAPGNSSYLIGYAPGDFTMPGNGGSFTSNPRRGVLVVRGNLTLSDESHWDGIILVGGYLRVATTNAEFMIHGAVITGLNTQLGMSVPPDSLPRPSSSPYAPTRRLHWSYCHIHASADALSGMSPRPASWMDTWALY